jgi:hypothetical protein
MKRSRYRRWGGGATVLAAALGGALSVGSILVSCRTAGLKRVFMSLDEQGNRRRTTFFTDTEAIYCIGELVSGRTDLTVQSTIRAKTLYDPALDDNVPVGAVGWTGESAPGKTNGALIAFGLGKALGNAGTSQPEPFPVGTFTCELALDGEPEDSVDFEIAFPPCPMLPPVTGQICGGWVRAGSRCEGAGARRCVCHGPSGAWQCD